MLILMKYLIVINMDNEILSSIFKECQDLSAYKNKRYGDEPLKLFGLKGIVTRLSDKFFRLKNLSMNEGEDADDESIEDTLKDMINYCGYGIMLIRGDL